MLVCLWPLSEKAVFCNYLFRWAQLWFLFLPCTLLFLFIEVTRNLLTHRSGSGSGNLVQNWQIWVKSMRENALAALFRDLGYKIAFYPAYKTRIFHDINSVWSQKECFQWIFENGSNKIIIPYAVLVGNLLLPNSFDTFDVYSSEVLFSCLSLVLMMTFLVLDSSTAKERWFSAAFHCSDHSFAALP